MHWKLTCAPVLSKNIYIYDILKKEEKRKKDMSKVSGGPARLSSSSNTEGHNNMEKRLVTCFSVPRSILHHNLLCQLDDALDDFD
jgi:hypothetical protein